MLADEAFISPEGTAQRCEPRAPGACKNSQRPAQNSSATMGVSAMLVFVALAVVAAASDPRRVMHDAALEWVREMVALLHPAPRAAPRDAARDAHIPATEQSAHVVARTSSPCANGGVVQPTEELCASNTCTVTAWQCAQPAGVRGASVGVRRAAQPTWPELLHVRRGSRHVHRLAGWSHCWYGGWGRWGECGAANAWSVE